MQAKVDWTTGGLKFYDADSNKAENLDDFKSSEDINKYFDPVPSVLPIDKRVELIKSVGSEIVGEEDIKARLLKK